jgi:hypothetical protein
MKTLFIKSGFFLASNLLSPHKTSLSAMRNLHPT